MYTYDIGWACSPVQHIFLIDFLGGHTRVYPGHLSKKKSKRGLTGRLAFPQLPRLAELRQWMDILAELGRGTQNDLLSVEGWLLAVRETLRLKRGRGLFFAGHPCHPWLWMNSWNHNPIIIILHIIYRCVFCLYVKSWQARMNDSELRFVWISTGTHYRHLAILGAGGSPVYYACAFCFWKWIVVI